MVKRRRRWRLVVDTGCGVLFVVASPTSSLLRAGAAVLLRRAYSLVFCCLCDEVDDATERALFGVGVCVSYSFFSHFLSLLLSLFSFALMGRQFAAFITPRCRQRALSLALLPFVSSHSSR